jgi:hypothetical protein
MGRFDILKQDDSQNRELEVYKSGFNFSEYEMEDMDTVKRITETEEEIMRTAKQIAKKTLEVGKLLYETQQLMANYKNGTFVAWFTYMKMDKNTVYRAIDRYKMFLNYKNPQIANASIRTIEFLKKNEEKLTTEDINKVLEETGRTPEVIKQIKNRVEEDIETKEIIEDKLTKLNYKKEKLKEEIIKTEGKIELLEKQLKKIGEAGIVLEKYYIAEEKNILGKRRK